MTRPRALDAFCGQGGTTKGLLDAGYDVDGVDRADHSRRYPGRFILGDALDYIAAHGHEYDLIFAGPPCQGYSIATAGNPAARAKYDRLIPAVRDLLEATGRPYVIENVEQARGELRDPILLCGRMFGLGALDEDGAPLVLDRHRLFETNMPIVAPSHPRHGDEQVAGVYGGARRSSKPDATPADDRYAARYERRGGYVPRSKRVQQQLLGIDWMTVRGMQESIPPAFSEWLGRRIREHVEGVAA